MIFWIYFFAALALLFLVSYFYIRAKMVADYRRQWFDAVKDDADAQALFRVKCPSYSRMLWSFKRLKDSNWFPADVRAARYMQDLDPDTRAKLKTWLEKKRKV